MYKMVKKTYEIGELSHKRAKQVRQNPPQTSRLSRPFKGRKSREVDAEEKQMWRRRGSRNGKVEMMGKADVETNEDAEAKTKKAPAMVEPALWEGVQKDNCLYRPKQLIV